MKAERPMSVCAQLTQRACTRGGREGRIKDFTGIDSPHEAPLRAECEIDTQTLSIADTCHRLSGLLINK
jgi:adenylylsulfate kinase